jgi:hypothetical protein
VRVSEDDTDLGRRKSSLGELEDLVRDLLGGGLGPRWLRTSEWQGGCRDTFSVRVHSVCVSLVVEYIDGCMWCTYRPMLAILLDV